MVQRNKAQYQPLFDQVTVLENKLQELIALSAAAANNKQENGK